MSFITILLASLGLIASQEIKRVEPPCWWVDMQTPLTLMIYGDDLAGSQVACSDKSVTVKDVHDADSPNYLFVDVALSENTRPGEYDFTVTTPSGNELSFKYSFLERRPGSAQRLSFGPSDVLYLLVPDRFANGDPNNDSSPLVAEKANRRNLGGRHGGDLKGIMDHYDYLSDLGVTTIWPIPVLLDNESSYSYHGYACADYYMVDPRYGTNELYKEAVALAHSKGLKFIQDLVVNHCGTAHWWMKDLPFTDWITTFDTYTGSNWAMSTHSDPHASEYDKRICTTGWFDTTMADMNMKNPFLLQYFSQWAIWWVEYADLDGLRVDTYPYTEKHAVAAWTENILKEYPNLTIVGECWFHEVSEIAYWEGGKINLNGEVTRGWEVKNRDGFTSHLPMVMDFRMLDQLSAFVENDKNPFGNGGMRRVYDALSLDNVYTNPYNLLVFMSNHDTNRPFYLLENNVSRMKNLATLILTTRGVPQLYYGDEVLLQSADGTTGHSQERRDFPGGWKSDKVNAFTEKGRTAEQNEYFNHLRTLLSWRKNSKAVCEGQLKHFLPQDNTYIYFRYYGDELVMVAINNSTKPYKVDWTIYKEIFGSSKLEMTDILTGSKFRVGEDYTIPAMSSVVAQ